MVQLCVCSIIQPAEGSWPTPPLQAPHPTHTPTHPLTQKHEHTTPSPAIPPLQAPLMQPLEVERQTERALAYAAITGLLGASGLALAAAPNLAVQFLWSACPSLLVAGLARTLGSTLLLAAVCANCLKASLPQPAWARLTGAEGRQHCATRGDVCDAHSHHPCSKSLIRRHLRRTCCALIHTR